ncbi:MAG: SRPBCC family protein [Sporocytophaga sp.]|uniref:SRPBCC family protein n=1 Tax=Sporocytophaga sp. TaxID=2231183 RepID=UPI001B2CD76F|nr:SRPBCC family protein [Sporocytophaga sp.]MBO9699771.1 SRPBCC family protein [Sporocytophaga sp.]
MAELQETYVSSPDREVLNVRIVKASREQVFKAWSNPEYLKRWWGPEGFANTFNEFNFQPGGKWSFVMHGPDKKDYPNESVFVKIEEPGLVVLNHISQPKFQIEATFEAISVSETKVYFRMIFKTPEECNKLKGFVTDKNEENLDRLGAVLKDIK